MVRRIFREYASGRSPKEIAVQLNRESIPGLRNRPWIDAPCGDWHRHPQQRALRRGSRMELATLHQESRDSTRVSRISPEGEGIRAEVPRLLMPARCALADIP